MNYGQIIHRTSDDSYVITKNGFPYHVYPYAAEFAQEWDEVFGFCKAVGLPTKLADLGIAEVKEEEIRKVAEAACVPTQSTKNLRADITAQEVYDAILEADRIGRDYLAR